MVWERLGFSENPLFAEELPASHLTEELFVGREDEISLLSTALTARNGGLLCVGGIPGCGKSTLVNRFQYLVFSGRVVSPSFTRAPAKIILPAARSFELRVDDSAKSVLQKAISCATVQLMSFCKAQGVKVPKELLEIDTAFHRLSLGGSSIGFEATVLGSGGGFTKGSDPEVNPGAIEAELPLIALYRRLTREIAPSLGVHGLFIVVDNTETIEDERVLQFVNEMRDVAFKSEGVWWILIGRERVGGVLATRAPRLRGYMPIDGVDVKPLRDDDVLEILRRREEKFAKRDGARLPIPDDIVRFVYSSSNGDLRFTFGFLQKALVALVMRGGNFDKLDVKGWNALLVAELAKVLDHMRQENPGLWQTASRIIQLTDVEITAADFRRYGFKNAAVMEASLETLMAHDMLWRRRGAKNQICYTPRGLLEMARKLHVSTRAWGTS